MTDQRSAPESGHRRAAIDAGRTGDKVPVADPATAPMDTDAETAGTPTPRSVAAADVSRQERIARQIDPDIAPVAANRTPTGPATRSRAVAVGAILLVLVVAALVLAGLVLPRA